MTKSLGVIISNRSASHFKWDSKVANTSFGTSWYISIRRLLGECSARPARDATPDFPAMVHNSSRSKERNAIRGKPGTFGSHNSAAAGYLNRTFRCGITAVGRKLRQVCYFARIAWKESKVLSGNMLGAMRTTIL